MFLNLFPPDHFYPLSPRGRVLLTPDLRPSALTSHVVWGPLSPSASLVLVRKLSVQSPDFDSGAGTPLLPQGDGPVAERGGRETMKNTST